jgi:hypothetical protein
LSGKVDVAPSKRQDLTEARASDHGHRCEATKLGVLDRREQRADLRPV